MKRWLVVTLSVFGVLALAAAAGAWWLTRPTEAADYETVLDQERVARNTAVLSVLADAGLTEAFADVTDQGVIIAFAADEARGDDARLDEMMRTALATAAGIAPDAPMAYILATFDEAPALSWEADIPTFKDMIEGRMGEDAYVASIVVTSH